MACAAALKEVDSRLQAFDEAQMQMESLLESEEQIEAAIGEVGPYRDGIVDTRIDAEEAFKRFFEPNPAPSDASEYMTGANVRLPKIELPKFGGDCLEWTPYWECFEAAVHRTTLSDVNKFTYLKSILYGDAAKVIEGLALTAAHYTTAVELLKKRYGRTDLLVVTHVQALLGMETLKNGDIAKLRGLMDQLRKHVRSLEALNIKGEQYGVFLTPIVLSKLPHGLRLEWARGSEEKESDLDYLLQFFEQEICRRERSLVFA